MCKTKKDFEIIRKESSLYYRNEIIDICKRIEFTDEPEFKYLLDKLEEKTILYNRIKYQQFNYNK